MIGRHPELYGMPELKLFCYPTIGQLDASLPDYHRDRGIVHRSPGLVRAVAELGFGGQFPQSVAAAREWLARRPQWTGAAVFDMLQAQVAPRSAVEKSPENVESAAALGRLVAAYPRARFLHLTRHPATSQRSMHDHWCRTMPDSPVEELAQVCAETWLDTHRRILAMTAHAAPDRYLRVRAEDILNEPSTHLPVIARWLGVASEEDAIEAMRHPERSPFACLGPAGSGVSGGNDPAFLSDPIPRPVALPPDLETDLETDLESDLERVADLARQLGY